MTTCGKKWYYKYPGNGKLYLKCQYPSQGKDWIWKERGDQSHRIFPDRWRPATRSCSSLVDTVSFWFSPFGWSTGIHLKNSQFSSIGCFFYEVV